MMQIYWYSENRLEDFIVDRFVQVENVILPSDWNIGIFNPSTRPRLMRASALPAEPISVRKVTLEIEPSDTSYRYRALMERPQLVLKFSLPRFVEIPVGAWCKFQGQTFYLNSPENLKKQGSRNIEYTVTMGTAQDNLTLYKMRNTVDGRLKYSMCAKPHEFIEEIVKNLNLRDYGEVTTEGTWRCDRNLCITANEKTVEFNHTYILEALSQVAQAFETEWEIIENEDNGTFTIALHKVEYLKEDPLDLSYGRGNGFVPGVGRTTQLDALPIKRLYTEGTERNIDRSKNDVSMYGGTKTSTDTTSPELRLPSAQKILYDGSHYAYLDAQDNIIDREDGFVEAAARCYKTDRDGFYVERHYRTGEKYLQATKEDSLDCSEIYPSRYGAVTRVEQVKNNPNFYDVYDADIDDELDFNNYIIEGETMTLIFQSGMLAGKEFEVKYRHNVRKFELVPQEIDGVVMPNDVFKPVIENEYAIFGIMLPPSYICNNTTHKGAAWDMFREAVRYLYENEEQKYTFTGELQGLWAKRNWLRVGGYMKVGAYINFSDPQFAPDGELIRIVGIKDLVNAPYSPTVEIANSVSGGRSVSSSLKKIENTEVVITDTKNELLRFTKRRYRDAKETLEALSDIMGENFSAGINPVTVETMAALIGDESMQFRFVRITHDADKDIYTETNFPYQYSNSSGFHIDHCYIQHLTLNQSLTASRDYSSGDYDVWEMREFPEFYLDPERYGRLFLYAVCPKVGNTTGYRVGEFTFSEDKRTFDDGSNYNLLIGIMSSEYEGERSFVTVYGFTEILPGRITTDTIASTDGESIINLRDGSMQLGDCLAYNVGGDKTLHLKFLTSDGAQIGGWIVKNGKLYAPNDSMFFDGDTGAIHLKGTIQHSTATSGNYSNVDLFSLPKRTTPKETAISMGVEDEDIGKRCLLTNMSDFGTMGYYRIAIQRFGWTDEHTKYIGTSESYIISPGETIEMTCFALKNGDTVRLNNTDYTVQRGGFWKITNRYNREIPRAVAMGTVTNSTTGATIKGWSLGGSDMQVSRNGTGSTDATYTITLPEVFANSNGLLVMVHGVGTIQGGNNPIKATLISQSGRTIVVRTSDDETDNAGSFNFLCYDVEGWIL